MAFLIPANLFSEESDLPAPYRRDEFPQWTLDLRRAEVITVGSFPLSFMLSALLYDATYFAIDSIESENTGDAQFGSHREQEDITRLLLISGGVSLSIGIADFIIHQVRRNRAEREEQELNEQRRDQGQSTRVGEDQN